MKKNGEDLNDDKIKKQLEPVRKKFVQDIHKANEPQVSIWVYIIALVVLIVVCGVAAYFAMNFVESLLQ